MFKSARVVVDAIGFIGLYALIESDLLEKENPQNEKKISFIEASARVLSHENILVNQRVEEISQLLLTANLTNKLEKRISKRDWAECIEKLFSSDLNAELQSISMKEKFQNERVTTQMNLESFSPKETINAITFKCATPKTTATSDSPLLHHPLTQILCVLSEASHKHAILNERYLKNMDSVEEQLAIAHAERMSPDDAGWHEINKNLLKLPTFIAFFYFSSKAFLGMKADVPIFHSLMARSVQVSEGVWEKRSSFLRSSGRWLLGLLVLPIALGVMNWNDEKIKKWRLTDWLYSEEIARVLSNSSSQSSSKTLHTPITPSTPFINDNDENIANEVEKELLTALLEPSQRPVRWMGASATDPMHQERIRITLLHRAITDAVLFYSFLLKHLLSYSHPAVAHLVTALVFILTREDEGEGRPDIINVLQNLPFYESFASFANRALIQQFLYHLSGGSLYLPFMLDVLHRGQYLLWKETLFSLPVYPIELSPFSWVFLSAMTPISGLISRVLSKQSYYDWNQLVMDLRPHDASHPPVLSPLVLKEIPNVKEIIQQFSKDIFFLYSSDHFSDKHLQTLSHADLCNCIVRLENYKRHFLPPEKTHPLYFIDDKAVKRLLSVISPERLERISEEMKASSKSQSAYEQLLHRDNNERGKQFTDRSSYMKVMQPALSELPLNEFVRAIMLPSSLSLDHNEKKASSSPSTMISALHDLHLHTAVPLVNDLYFRAVQVHYPSGKITQTDFEHFFTAYLNTIEPHTLIEELKKMEEAIKKEHQGTQSKQIKQEDEKNNKNTMKNNLYSHMRYYEDVLINGIKKREELLDIIQEFYSSIMKADEMVINGMESMLLYELQSSLLGRSVSHLERIPPYGFLPANEFNRLPAVLQRMLIKKQMFFHDFLVIQALSRERYLQSVLYEHGLTVPYFKYLIKKYSAHYPEVQQLVETWESYFDPTAIPLSRDRGRDEIGEAAGDRRKQRNDVVWSIKYVNSNNYPERLKKLLIKDESDVVRRMIYDDVTVGRMSSLKNKTREQSKEG